jgi:thiol-disulfide isomerase/thioredoxin
LRVSTGLLFGILLASSALAKTEPSRPTLHRRIPDFVLPTRTGFVSPDSMRGRVVLVDFWASWCGPCRRSFPWMSELYDRYSAKGFRIVAIDLDKSRDQADTFLESFPAPFTVAFDPTGKTAEAFHVSAMPSSFVIGPDGTILYSHAGFDPRKTGPIEDLIKEAYRQ